MALAAFEGPKGKTIVVRNHELSPTEPTDEDDEEEDETPYGTDAALLEKVPLDRIYDFGKGDTFCPGGTTTFIYDTRTQKLEREWLSLVGTVRNCAGGPTPWGSWITCEETVLRRSSKLRVDHGYNFEVPARATGLVDPIPLKDMGRFVHEAIAVDPKSGAIYQTEDTGDGLIYRFLPNEPGKLQAGGRLQCLVAADARRLDTRNWDGQIAVTVGQEMDVRWADLDNVDAPYNDLRYRGHYDGGAARFSRGEGMWYGNDAVYFASTDGGPGHHGQIWKYTPSPAEGTDEEMKNPGRLELFAEASSSAILDRADNLTVAPCGDLIVTEDGPAGIGSSGLLPRGSISSSRKTR